MGGKLPRWRSIISQLADQLNPLGERLVSAPAEAHGAAPLESVRVRFLGRSGEVTALRRGIGSLPPAERPEAGKVVNEAVTVWERLGGGAGRPVADAGPGGALG